MLKFNPRLKGDIQKYIDYVIIVEGKKDVNFLNQLGFQKVYAVHETGVPIKEKLLEISKQLDKKDKVCILTDLDRKGKKLYMLIKEELQELRVRLDSSFRGLLLKSQISHIEDMAEFIKKTEKI